MFQKQYLLKSLAQPILSVLCLDNQLTLDQLVAVCLYLNLTFRRIMSNVHKHDKMKSNALEGALG
jgi:hypothetical protein